MIIRTALFSSATLSTKTVLPLGPSVIYGTAGNDTDLKGTSAEDAIYGLAGNDFLYGLAGSDLLDGGLGADMMAGGTGDDTYYVDNIGDLIWEWGGEGYDTVYTSVSYTLPSSVERLFLHDPSATQGTGNELDNYINGGGPSGAQLYGLAGNDALVGGEGNDYLYGGADNDNLDGSLGADVMAGGTGNDEYYVRDAGDVVWEWGGEGTDVVFAYIDYTLPDAVENLQLSDFGVAVRGTGNSLDNDVLGNSAANTIIGAGGRDTLTGGAGADRFVWNFAEETGTTVPRMDVISDFNFGQGDRIDLSAVDANTYAAGDQAFTFIGQGAFTGTPGEINYYYSGGNTIIQLQTGMDPDIEGGIVLNGLHTPDASWFTL